MEREARIFRSFAEAEQAETDYYRSLTPEQRMEILFELIDARYPGMANQKIEKVCRIVKLKDT